MINVKTADEQSLMECAVCGKSAYVRERNIQNGEPITRYEAICSGCGHASELYRTVAEAASEWNKMQDEKKESESDKYYICNRCGSKNTSGNLEGYAVKLLCKACGWEAYTFLPDEERERLRKKIHFWQYGC